MVRKHSKEPPRAGGPWIPQASKWGAYYANASHINLGHQGTGTRKVSERPSLGFVS